MKRVNLMSLAVLILAVMFASCEKTNVTPDLTKDIVGTYVGTISDNESLTTKSATVDVSITGENEVEIHCYSELMDTIFTMDLYQNQDSIMVCFSDEESFYNQYGQHMSGNHHMMGDGESYNWMHHLDEEHENTDMHFGGFDTSMHTFNYLFQVHSTTSQKELHFIGSKQ